MTTATLAPPRTPPAVPAHRRPAFLRYLGGQAVSILGDQVWYVALSFSAVQLASPGTAGVVLAVSALPRLVLLLFGGAIVDRYGPRRLMIGSDLARGAIALVTAAVALAQPSVALLVVVALAFGLADALFLPAAGAMLPRLLPPTQLTGGLALSGLTARLALTFGAPLGGLLLPLGGLPLACLVNAATFAVSVLALWSVRPTVSGDAASIPATTGGSAAPVTAPESAARATAATGGSAALATAADGESAAPATAATRGSAALATTAGPEDGAAPARASIGSAVREGLRYLARHPLLRSVTLVGLLINLGAVGPLNVGLALVADERGWGAGGIGVMLAGFGAGSVAGNLLMLRWRPAGRLGVIMACCAVVQCGALFAIAVAPLPAWAFVATAVGGLAGGPQAVLLSGLTHTYTADSHRGRVASINNLASLGVTPLAMAVMGFAAAHLGTVSTFAASASLILVAAAMCVTIPALRHARLPRPSSPTPTR
ncbi:MFS transporter [Catellatospora sichuanensis]|uniref:MFS transporter n=1 Tax=Catellatospora sichuanensis TaxID=1969805 RepID=UPI00118225A7|nr:MFS transporter [Catellatospora sichuanensis]